jgi:hypothetical protein
VAAGEQRDEDALEHPLLADDHPLDLEQGGFEALPCVAHGPQPRRLVVHCVLSVKGG